MIHVEFAGGGPIDGNRRDFPGEPPTIPVYTPRLSTPVSTFDRGDLASNVGVDTHIYRRAHRLTVTGYEVYLYAGKEKRS
jgi:hypothetical protein